MQCLYFYLLNLAPYTTSRGLFLILIFPNRGRSSDLLVFQDFGFLSMVLCISLDLFVKLTFYFCETDNSWRRGI